MSPGIGSAVIFEIVDRVLRSWWTVVAGGCLGLTGSLAALHVLPKTYEASTTIFVAPQQVPQDFVKSTVTDDMSMRLASLREAVLSRPYLSKLIEQSFSGTADGEALERLIMSMRSRIEVAVIENERLDRGRSGGIFKLTYRDNNPDRAALVVNKLAQFYIDQNVRFRSSQAEGTTRTLESLATDVFTQLQVKEREVADFKSQHLYETQSHFDANVQLLEGRQEDLKAVERDLGQAQDRLQTLKGQETQSTVSAGTGGTAGVLDPYTARLTQLQREYETLRARYRDDHPDVKAKKRELEDFIAVGTGAGPAGEGEEAGGSAGRPPLTPLQAQMQVAQREVTRFAAEEARLKGEIETYKRRIEATPRVEQQLSELSKGLDVLRERYRDYQSKLEEAKGSQKIEADQKGERFEVIERAAPPSLPIRPVPMVLYALGLLGGLGLFVGPVVLYALVVPTVSSETGLTALAEVPVLVTLPRLRTPEVARSGRMRSALNLGLSVLAIAVLASAVGYFGLGG